VKENVQKLKQKMRSNKKNIAETVTVAASGTDNALDKLSDTLDKFGPLVDKIRVFADISTKIGEVSLLDFTL
jgi:hypothetical protein